MEKYAGTQSIARTFAIIKLFDDTNPVWSLADLIEASGLKRTTVFRILSALDAEGIIKKTESGEYRLGHELIRLGGRAIRSNRLRSVARPHLETLVRNQKESATIDVLIDDDGTPKSMVIEEHLGQHLLGMAQYIGASFEAHTTSTGKVLLAHQTDLSNYKLDNLVSTTANTITKKKRLLEELKSVKQQGYATTVSEREEGLVAVAVPLYNHHAEVIAALCIAGPSSRMMPDTESNKIETIVTALKESAQNISKALGSPEISSLKLSKQQASNSNLLSTESE